MSHPYVLSRAQMQAVDRTAVERSGLPSVILMENAGRGVAEAIARRLSRPADPRDERHDQRHGQPWRVAVVCGAGNNGGDGSVLARHLALAGAEVNVLLAAPRAKILQGGGDAALMLRALDGQRGVTVSDLSGEGDRDAWGKALAGTDAVVDALFGTGLRADVTGVAAAAIAAINAAAGLKVAVDIPSGMDADDGRAHGAQVRPDVTVTMGARKLGLVVDPEVAVGEVEVVGLGLPVEPPPALGPFCHWLDQQVVRASLPVRSPAAHKGSGGHLVVVAGSAGKTGAALLTARSALRAGAGLVTVASTAAGQAALDAKVIEEMTTAFSQADDADAGSFAAVAELCRRPNVRGLALGPGIPLGEGMRGLVERLARELGLAMVIDADGLNLLGARAAEILAAAPAARIVTPHPGEMGRLSGQTTVAVQSDRLGTARAFAAASRAIVVLKGPRTLVVQPDGTAFINPAVEPALATAGSGDVLTGVVGGLLAQGMDPTEAACAAVFVHGAAGTRAAREHGSPGVVAGDLPDAVAAVRVAWSSGSAATSTGPGGRS